MARLLHLDVECVARFVLVRWNYSKRVLPGNTPIFALIRSRKQFKGHVPTYDMQTHRFTNRLKTSL